jgi:hypothetical protein
MTWTLTEIHNFIDFVLDKEMGSWVSPKEKDMALHRAQMDEFNELIYLYAQTGFINNAIEPFKKEYAFASVVNGLVIVPGDDYEYLRSVVTTVYNNTLLRNVLHTVEIIGEDEIGQRVESQLRPVSVNKPVGVITGKGKIQLFPNTAQSGTVYYFRTPVKPTMVYTMVGRVLTPDEINSVQLEWKESQLQKIIMGALVLLGVNVENDRLINYAREKRTTA